ncbi:holo-ACP synthase [Candidatus Kapabacteria bacterium]|nr:holo-ACP synthase [Candidatus Kapabacteria bacterium]
MIYGIGHDIVECQRIKKSVEKLGDRFKDKIFTETEKQYCNQFKLNDYLHYAARFAAKEAFSKAIGTGFSGGFNMKEVGVVNKKSGQPEIELSGSMLEKWGHLKSNLTMSHTDRNAVAIVILETLE